MFMAIPEASSAIRLLRHFPSFWTRAASTSHDRRSPASRPPPEHANDGDGDASISFQYRSSSLEAVRRAGSSIPGPGAPGSAPRFRRRSAAPSAVDLATERGRRRTLDRRLFEESSSGPPPLPGEKVLPAPRLPPDQTVRQRRAAETLSRNVSAMLDEAAERGLENEIVRTKAGRGGILGKATEPLCVAAVDREAVEIVRVDVAADLRDATVRWCLPFSADRYAPAQRGKLARNIHASLRGGGGRWIRRRMAERMRGRKWVPRLHFEWDEAEEMEELLAGDEKGVAKWWREDDNTRRRRVMRELGVILPKDWDGETKHLLEAIQKSKEELE
mmetsp:Transcript_24520/g.56042  ORF Transcript_24520/g.56042 Transcript_24520/m.56042 type:complete len:331 (-) Transcript_24520:105-1097(-)